MADQKSKIKELIQLMITNYDNLRARDNTTTSRAAITNFLETNKDMTKTADALWSIITDQYKTGTPPGNQVNFFYNEFKSKIKELIQLLITYYKHARANHDTTTSDAAITKFFETNKDMTETADALWRIITEETEVPPVNQVNFFYNKFKSKGGKGRRSSRSNRKRRHASKGKRFKGCTRCRQCKCRTRRGGNMFHGSNATAPVVCLDGNSKIPCTAFSSG
jgi:RNAse (barnase) inhibitor barstar